MTGVTDHDRNIDVERLWTTEAAATRGAPPEALIELAEQRAGDGQIRDLTNRDFGMEALEELADTRNYLLWWVEQIIAKGGNIPAGAQLVRIISDVLAEVVVAFDAVSEVRDAQALRELGAR